MAIDWQTTETFSFTIPAGTTLREFIQQVDADLLDYRVPEGSIVEAHGDVALKLKEVA